MGKFIKFAFLLLLALLQSGGALAFPCRTDFGLVEVPGTQGFTPGDNVVRKIIQRTKKAIGGQNGKVVSVLVREEERNEKGNFSELISLSQTSIEAEITAADFAQIVEATRKQISELSEQALKGMRFGGFQSGDGYYCNTLDIFVDGAPNAEAAYTIMGGVFLRGHLYSVVAHTAAAHSNADRAAWMKKCTDWIQSLVAANRAALPKTPLLASIPNIDDYALAGLALEKTERVRTKGRGGPDALDVRIEHPKSMKEVAAPPGVLVAVEREVDGYAFRMEVGETRFDAALDAALDALAAAKGDTASAMAAELAQRLAAADAPGATSPILATGILPVDGRNAVWRDTWRPAQAGDPDSGRAVKTVWLQAADCRALKIEFTLRDKVTPLVPVADMAHFNMVMVHSAGDTSIQNKKQFKKK